MGKEKFFTNWKCLKCMIFGMFVTETDNPYLIGYLAITDHEKLKNDCGEDDCKLDIAQFNIETQLIKGEVK